MAEAERDIIRAVTAEVEQLRDLLKRLEWTGNVQMESSVPICPACRADAGWGHTDDCWLAAEIGREEP